MPIIPRIITAFSIAILIGFFVATGFVLGENFSSLDEEFSEEDRQNWIREYQIEQLVKEAEALKNKQK